MMDRKWCVFNMTLVVDILHQENGYHASHYSDVTMGAMASLITSITNVYLTVNSGADQIKHQSSASLVLCGEFTGHRWIPRTNGQWRGKCFHWKTSSFHQQLWYGMSTQLMRLSWQAFFSFHEKCFAKISLWHGTAPYTPNITRIHRSVFNIDN